MARWSKLGMARKVRIGRRVAKGPAGEIEARRERMRQASYADGGKNLQARKAKA